MDKTVSGSELMVAAIAGRAERWRLMEPSSEWLQQVNF